MAALSGQVQGLHAPYRLFLPTLKKAGASSGILELSEEAGVSIPMVILNDKHNNLLLLETTPEERWDLTHIDITNERALSATFSLLLSVNTRVSWFLCWFFSLASSDLRKTFHYVFSLFATLRPSRLDYWYII